MWLLPWLLKIFGYAVLCASWTLKLLMGFALASKYVTAAHKAPCERDKAPAVLVFTVSVLGWIAYKMWERVWHLQTEAHPFFFNPRTQ